MNNEKEIQKLSLTVYSLSEHIKNFLYIFSEIHFNDGGCVEKIGGIIRKDLEKIEKEDNGKYYDDSLKESIISIEDDIKEMKISFITFMMMYANMNNFSLTNYDLSQGFEYSLNKDVDKKKVKKE